MATNGSLLAHQHLRLKTSHMVGENSILDRLKPGCYTALLQPSSEIDSLLLPR